MWNSFRTWLSQLVAPKTEKSVETETSNEVSSCNNYEGMNKRQLLETVMKNIGCHIDMRVEGDEFRITYQGEHFSITFFEDSNYICVYDICWYSADLEDIDNFSLVRQAINKCNGSSFATVLYTIDKEEKQVNVHTRQCVIFGTFIPYIEDYMRSLFEDSFKQHHAFYRNMEEIRKNEFAS